MLQNINHSPYNVRDMIFKDNRVEQMQQPESHIHHRRSHRLRRLVGVGGMILALAIILSVTVYAYNGHASIFGARGGLPSIPGLPGIFKPASTCTTPLHDSGDSNGSITSGGLKRTFLIHLAPSYGLQPQPLVINYHNYSATAAWFAHYTNMSTEADKAGFVLVFPQGVDNPSSWNAGLNESGHQTGSADDVQFTRDLISYLEKNYCVDSHRVYVAGFSIGGGMAYRIACTLTNQVAAVATVSGAYYHAPGGCQPSRPIPVMEIHGQADPYAPYNGNPSAGMAAVQVYLNVWLNRNQCTGTSNVFFQKGDVTGIEWTHCAGKSVVVHYRVSDGGHVWPGAAHDNGLGSATQVIDANSVIWEFFSHYSI